MISPTILVHITRGGRRYEWQCRIPGCPAPHCRMGSRHTLQDAASWAAAHVRGHGVDVEAP